MGEKHGFDWITFVLAGFASAGAVYAMEKLGGEGTAWQLPALVLVLSLLSGVAAIFVARRNPATSLIDPRVDEAQELFAFGLWSERLSHRRLRAAVSSAAHVSNRFRLECLSVGALPAGAFRRRPEHEGICH